jgi:hypothetical protein
MYIKEKSKKNLIYVFAILAAALFLLIFTGTTAHADNKAQFSLNVNTQETACEALLTGFDLPSGGKNVQVAVWSEENGQDDLRWYNMKRSGTGYAYSINIADHKSAGTYCAHFYYSDNAGKENFITGGVFEISPVSSSGVTASSSGDASGSCHVVISGVSSSSGVQKVLVPVWTEAGGQDDIIWYPASKDPSGNYCVDISVASHGYQTGTYNIHAYGYGNNGVMSFLGKTTQDLQLGKAAVSASVSGNTVKISASGVPAISGVSRVQFVVWSETDGQDDISWTDASYNKAAGSASLNVSLENYKGYGKYQIHMYGINGSGSLIYLGETSINVPGPSCGSITVSRSGSSEGVWDVVISGVSSSKTVSSLTVPVWSKADQSDIMWYTASKNSNGSYSIQANVANHNFNAGTYNIHVYAVDKKGALSFLGSKTADYQPASMGMSVSLSGSSASISVGNIPNASNYTRVQFVVWSEKDGQDDIKWNNAVYSPSSRSARLVISLNDYRGYGTYQMHVYGINRSGTLSFLGKTAFELDEPTCSSVSVRNYSAEKGTWDVVISGIKSQTGIRSVTIPVWSKADQSDIVWYNAVKNSNGEYVASVKVSNHHNNTGTYNLHAYVTGNNGVMSYLGETTQNYINASNVDVSCIVTGSNSAQIKASGLPSGESTYAVFELDAGQDTISAADKPLAEKTGNGSVAFDIPLNMYTSQSVLTSRFVVGIKIGNGYTQISSGDYITNPEAVAPLDFAFPSAENKKGLQVNYKYFEDVIDLGVNHTIVNVTLNSLFAGGDYEYAYNGGTYYFSQSYINYLDAVTAEMAQNGVITSFIMLLQYDGQTADLILPGARTPGHSFYGFNTEEEAAVNKLEAAFTFLAERYSGSNVVNWILGNEADDYNTYYYSGSVSDEQAAGYYTDAYRLLYNCVKSVYANARIYISLDHMWTYERPNAMTGKQLIGYFTEELAEEGDLTWCLAYHPYPSPLTNANFWNTTSSQITNSVNSGVFTMKNLSTLTNYIRDTYGSDHRIILSETGFTSVSNGAEDQQLQAAAIAYAYYLAEFNDMVDSFIVHRHVDHKTEMQSGLYLGLWTNETQYDEERSTQKLAWTIYKFMDSPQYQQYTGIVLNKIGARSWESLVPGFNGSRFQ